MKQPKLLRPTYHLSTFGRGPDKEKRKSRKGLYIGAGLLGGAALIGGGLLLRNKFKSTAPIPQKFETPTSTSSVPTPNKVPNAKRSANKAKVQERLAFYDHQLKQYKKMNEVGKFIKNKPESKATQIYMDTYGVANHDEYRNYVKEARRNIRRRLLEKQSNEIY